VRDTAELPEGVLDEEAVDAAVAILEGMDEHEPKPCNTTHGESGIQGVQPSSGTPKTLAATTPSMLPGRARWSATIRRSARNRPSMSSGQSAAFAAMKWITSFVSSTVQTVSETKT
jgi:hypothetical protein